MSGRFAGLISMAILALLATFIGAALSVGGVISVVAARVFLALAWLVGSCGFLGSQLVSERPFRHRVILAAGWGIALGVCLLWLGSWIESHGPRASVVPTAPVGAKKVADDQARRREDAVTPALSTVTGTTAESLPSPARSETLKSELRDVASTARTLAVEISAFLVAQRPPDPPRDPSENESHAVAYDKFKID